MKRLHFIKQWFFLAEPESWDSPTSAINFLLGALLFVGLFSFARQGASRIHFLLSEGTEPTLHVINLIDDPQVGEVRGYVEVTGYVGPPKVRTFYGGELDIPEDFFFYPLLSAPDERPVSDTLYVLYTRGRPRERFRRRTACDGRSGPEKGGRSPGHPRPAPGLPSGHRGGPGSPDRHRIPRNLFRHSDGPRRHAPMDPARARHRWASCEGSSRWDPRGEPPAPRG